ncbi:MAG: ankyrin repeat domain-containing protein, partial [Acidobacteriota bacterium]
AKPIDPLQRCLTLRYINPLKDSLRLPYYVGFAAANAAFILLSFNYLYPRLFSIFIVWVILSLLTGLLLKSYLLPTKINWQALVSRQPLKRRLLYLRHIAIITSVAITGGMIGLAICSIPILDPVQLQIERVHDDRKLLVWAVSYGDIKTVQALLNKGLDPNTVDSDGHTILINAILSGHTDVVKVLLEKGANPNQTSESSYGYDHITPLMTAVKYSYIDIVKVLLDQGANINFRSGRDISALDLAVENDLPNIVRLLLDRGADNGNSLYSREALIWAAKYNYYDILQKLLDKGVDLNAKDKTGKTPLIEVATNGYNNAVRLFIDKGADLNATDIQGQTALFGAVISAATSNTATSDTSILELLLNKGADLQARDVQDWTPFMWAANLGRIEIVNLLLSRGAKVNTKSNTGETPLMLAAGKGYYKVIKILIDKGADINAKDYNGRTVLMRVSGLDDDNGYHSVNTVKLLLSKGADPNLQDKYGSTALIGAAQQSHQVVVAALLDGGADTAIKDKRGKTAAMLAAHETIVPELLEFGVQVLETGAYYSNDISARSGQLWFGIYPTKQGCELKASRVKVTYSGDDYETYIDDIGVEVTVDKSTKPIFLVKGMENLVAGPIKSIFYNVSDKGKLLTPGQKIGFELDGKTYILKASGKIEDNSIKNYRLLLIDGEQSQVLLSFSYDLSLDTIPQLVWVGDLDADNRLDLYIGNALYLSSMAKSGQLVRKVAELQISADGC